MNLLEKFFSTFKCDLGDTPSSKLRSMLNAIKSHFVSLERAEDAKIFTRFNPMRLRIILKMIEGDRVGLITDMKNIQDALDEGGQIYKSCLIFPKFIVDIDKKIKECEG